MRSLIKDLAARGCLSTLPRLSPFSPELSGHSDLEAVRNWLSGAATVCLAFMMFSCIFMHSKIAELQT